SERKRTLADTRDEAENQDGRKDLRGLDDTLEGGFGRRDDADQSSEQARQRLGRGCQVSHGSYGRGQGGTGRRRNGASEAYAKTRRADLHRRSRAHWPRASIVLPRTDTSAMVPQVPST